MLPARRLATWCFSVSCLLLAALPTQTHAQGAVIVSSEVDLHSSSRYEVFGSGPDRTILYRDEPGKVYLDAYDSDMKLDWSRELDLDKVRPQPIGALVHEEEVVVLYTYRKNRGLHLKLHRYGERGNLSDSLTVLTLDGELLTPNWLLRVDENSEFAVLVNRRDSRTYNFIHLEVSTGRVLSTKVVKVDDRESGAQYDDEVYVDERGAAYFWSQRNNRASKLDEHAVLVTRVGVDGTVQTLTIKLPETLVYDLQLGVDEANGRVVLAGYYTDDSDEAHGLMVLSTPYAMTEDVMAYSVPFDAKVITSVDQKDRDPEGVRDIEVTDLIFRRDGSALIVGEQRRETLRTVGGRTGYFGGSLKTDYLYEDVVLAAVGPDGQNLWQEVLPKKQFSQDDGAAFSGYFLAATPRRVHVIYNDEVRNGGTVSEFSITGTGSIDRHSLMNTEYRDLWLRQAAAVQTGPSTVVIPSERRGRLKLVRVQF